MTMVDGYELVREIGRGGMGQVSLYRHKSTNDEIAVKVCIGAFTKSTRERVVQEADVLKNLDHENIISLLEFEMTETSCYIVMPFYDEGNLNQAIEARMGKPFDMKHMARLFMQLCRAIEHIHARSIIHRDVKPSNLLLANGGTTKTMTKGIGTLAFGAPELFDEEEGLKYDARVDVFSTGSTMFNLANLKPPFSGGQKAILKKLLVTETKDKYEEFCPVELREVIDLCMTFDYRKRPTIDFVIKKLEDKFKSQLTMHQISELNKQIDATIKKNTKMSQSSPSESERSYGHSSYCSDREEKNSIISRSSMSSDYNSGSLKSSSDKSDQKSRQQRSLLHTEITELDPVNHEAVRIRGHRFRNQMNRRETIIWKGFKCFPVKRELFGLEMLSDDQLIRMQPVMNNGIVPMHHYIQKVNDRKFLVFIYKAHLKRQIRLNGDDKTLENYFCGDVFKIGTQFFTYNGEQWVETVGT